MAALKCLDKLVPGALEAKDESGSTPVHLAVATNDNVAALVCLGELVPGALGAKNQYGKTPAHGAAGSDSVAALVCLDELVPGALEAKGGYGYTPAHQATNRGNVCLRLCLSSEGFLLAVCARTRRRPSLLTRCFAQEHGGCLTLILTLY